MQPPSTGAPCAFAPAPDQSAVSHLHVTVEKLRPPRPGWVVFDAVSGNVGFPVAIPDIAGRPEFAHGQCYMLEYPKSGHPFAGRISAIYPAHLKPEPKKEPVMNAVMPVSTQVLSMTSLEIAELVEKRHDNVMRTIETLAKQGVISLPQIEEVKVQRERRAETVRVYVFSGEKGKRDSIIVVAQLSPEFTARLVDRWQALEAGTAKPALPDFTNPAEAARAWASQFEEKLQLAHEVQQLAPKAQALERIAHANGLMNCTVAAKNLQVPPRRLFDWMREHHWIYRRPGGSGNVAYQDKIAAGYLTHKVTTVQRDDGFEKVVEQVLLTPKGLARLAQVFGGLPLAA